MYVLLYRWYGSPELYDLDRDRERLRLRLTRTGVEGLRESKKSVGGGPSAGSHAGGNRPRSSGCAGSPLQNNILLDTCNTSLTIKLPLIKWMEPIRTSRR